MVIRNTKFGDIEVPDDKVITMTRPVLGFENLQQFCLVEIDELSPFMWFQSTENSSIGFVVVNPAIFFPEYRIEVNVKEISDLNIRQVETVETYVIVTFPENPSEMSANLQGPILINTETNQARQLVLVNSQYTVQHRILDVVDAQPAVTELHHEEPVGV